MDPIAFSPPDVSEEDIAAVVQTLRSGWITTGPVCASFEQELAHYCGTAKAVCLSSATAALELVLRLLGIGPGDEVLVPAYTYTATASVVCHTGAKAIFIDCAPDHVQMDYDAMQQRIGPNTKAIIPVDFAGCPCDYDRLFTAVRETAALFRPSTPLQEQLGRVAVIADAAHSLGAEYHGRRSGALADFTCFSFHAVKNLTTGEGGAVLWAGFPEAEDHTIYRTFRMLSLHGQTKDALAKTQAGAWEYDILEPAYKCNMTDILAALGLSQLRRYPEMLRERRARVAYYDAALRGTPVRPLPHAGDGWRSSAHLYPVWIPGLDESSRGAVLTRMAEQGISANVHYKPLPMLTAYRNLGADPTAYPHAMARYQCEITLPLYPALTEEQQSRIVQTLLQALQAEVPDLCGTFHKQFP